MRQTEEKEIGEKRKAAPVINKAKEPKRRSETTKTLHIWNLGHQPYKPIWDLQHQLQQDRIQNLMEDTLLLVEHPPLYTIGKTGKESDIIGSPEFLKARQIDVLPVDRGGQVTYHGPGQLVGYPIFHLKENHRPSISWYIRSLEEVFIQALAHWGLEGRRIEKLTGVWVGEEKITALGVRMSRWVTMHGFAFNVNPSLEHYQGIVPCGIRDRGVTSLEKLLGTAPPMEEVERVVVNAIVEIFGFEELELDCRQSEMGSQHF